MTSRYSRYDTLNDVTSFNQAGREAHEHIQ